MSVEERLANLEAVVSCVKNDVQWVKEGMGTHATLTVKTANSIEDIKLLLAHEGGKRTVIRHLGTAAAVLIGGVITFVANLFSTAAAAAITKHIGGGQ